jgi:hypothetical protein
MQTTFIDPADLFRLVHFFDILAAVVFAVSGALVASRKGMDVMGFMWLAVITGVGGGTVRDLILDVPVFWAAEPRLRLCLPGHGGRDALRGAACRVPVPHAAVVRRIRPGPGHRGRDREGARRRRAGAGRRRDGRGHGDGRRHDSRHAGACPLGPAPARDLRHGVGAGRLHVCRAPWARRRSPDGDDWRVLVTFVVGAWRSGTGGRCRSSASRRRGSAGIRRPGSRGRNDGECPGMGISWHHVRYRPGRIWMLRPPCSTCRTSRSHAAANASTVARSASGE